MNRIIITLCSLFFIVIIFSLMHSQKIFDIQYELVKSEDISHSIDAWVFPPEKPMIAIEENRINWINNSEITDFVMPEDAVKVIFSKQANYFAIMRLNDISDYNKERNLQIDVCKSSKEKIYTVKRPYHYDDSLPLVAVSDLDGSLIIGQNTIGEVRFYNHTGSLIRNAQLFEDAEYDLERTLHIDISKDGTTAAIVAGKRGASPLGSNAPNPSAEPYLFLFTKEGKELLRKPLPDLNGAVTAISPNGQYIAAGSYTVEMSGNITKRTIIFDRNGREIEQTDMLFKLAAFSASSEWIILADNSNANVVDLSTGEILWGHEISKKNGMITAVDISDNGEIAVLLIGKSVYKDGKFIYTNPRLELLKNDGDLVQELEIADQEFEKPALKLFPDSKNIFIGFRNAYQIYRGK